MVRAEAKEELSDIQNRIEDLDQGIVRVIEHIVGSHTRRVVRDDVDCVHVYEGLEDGDLILVQEIKNLAEESVVLEDAKGSIKFRLTTNNEKLEEVSTLFATCLELLMTTAVLQELRLQDRTEETFCDDSLQGGGRTVLETIIGLKYSRSVAWSLPSCRRNGGCARPSCKVVYRGEGLQPLLKYVVFIFSDTSKGRCKNLYIFNEDTV